MRLQVAVGNNIMRRRHQCDFSALTFDERVKLAEAVADEVDVTVNADMPATFETIKLVLEFDRIRGRPSLSSRPSSSPARKTA